LCHESQSDDLSAFENIQQVTVVIHMNERTRNAVAEALEDLASQVSWNSDVWQHGYDLVKANWENELLAYVHDDLIHYDGLFHHSGNLLGLFHMKPDPHPLNEYRHKFRSIAAALRAGLSLPTAKKQFDL
jgi:hypothetical protein